jgi:hypothetical protein
MAKAAPTQVNMMPEKKVFWLLICISNLSLE